jgi:hypothetical protein
MIKLQVADLISLLVEGTTVLLADGTTELQGVDMTLPLVVNMTKLQAVDVIPPLAAHVIQRRVGRQEDAHLIACRTKYTSRDNQWVEPL